ncbi:MAG TPA: AraC family transcriptional regulator [Planctomycetota bacterium]|nr:AraC family transcriptional regulator [Planctomycetota bacterium]
MTSRRLTPKEWLQALRSEDACLEIQRWGYNQYRSAWDTERRTLDEDLMWLIVHGGFEGTVAKERVRFESGSVFWLSGGVEHDLRMVRSLLPCAVYHLRFILSQSGQRLRYKQDLVIIKDALVARPYFDEIVREMSFPGEFHRDRVRAILALMHSTVFTLQSRPVQRGRTFSGAQRQKVIRLIEENIEKRISPSQLAAGIGLTRDYFTLLFHRTFGMAPREWILRERVRRAAQRLTRTSESVTDVAAHFGYQDIFLFSRQFKKVFGCSPRAYRRGE